MRGRAHAFLIAQKLIGRVVQLQFAVGRGNFPRKIGERAFAEHILHVRLVEPHGKNSTRIVLNRRFHDHHVLPPRAVELNAPYDALDGRLLPGLQIRNPVDMRKILIACGKMIKKVAHRFYSEPLEPRGKSRTDACKRRKGSGKG